ncbi:MAG: protein kinase family protein [Propionibacteriaceae bacterium]|nr:protein kinase family protein [Propionibacteriaceae bacterium]
MSSEPMLPDGEMTAGQMLGGRYRLDHRTRSVDEVSIWAGEDETLSRPVTVYVIPPNHPRTDALIGASRRAAQAIDPRFLRVLDEMPDGPSEPVSFIVTENLGGVALADLLSFGPLPDADAAWVAREVAAALAPMHDAGFSHGALDPTEIIITASGLVRIKGFIIDALLAGGADDLAGGERADVAAIGYLLYAGLTGTWPGGGRKVPLPEARYWQGVLMRPSAQRDVTPALDGVCMQIVDPGSGGTPLRSAAAITLALDRVLAGLARQGLIPQDDLAARVAKAQRVGNSVTERVGREGLAPAAPVAPAYQEEPTNMVYPAPPAPVAPPVAPLTGLSRPLTPPPPPSAQGSPAVARLPKAPKLYRATGKWKLPRGWWIAPVVAVIIVLVLVIRGCSSGGILAPPQPTPAPVAAVSDFNPTADKGDGHENPDQVALATDGDPASCWTTRAYPQDYIPTSKPGVGVVLDFGSATTVSSLTLTMGAVPVNLSIMVPSGDAAQTDTAPMTSVTDWTSVLDTTVSTQPETLTLPDGTTTRFVLIYLTKLPEAEGGNGIQQTSICEVTATGLS